MVLTEIKSQEDKNHDLKLEDFIKEFKIISFIIAMQYYEAMEPENKVRYN